MSDLKSYPEDLVNESVIRGGGTAGSALATRLSKNPLIDAVLEAEEHNIGEPVIELPSNLVGLSETPTKLFPTTAREYVNVGQNARALRVLVTGRENAGKTTLLRKICLTVDDPEIFSPSGEKSDVTILDGSHDHGVHVIENELTFKRNLQFIFHDSRGFRSESNNELEIVEAFIARRVASNIFSEKLHAIWYCLPTDTGRPLLAAEERFLTLAAKVRAPIIVVFTKFEGLVTRAFIQLRKEGRSRKDAMNEQRERAKEMLNNDFLKPLMSMKYPPSDHVLLDNIGALTSSLDELMQKTGNGLSTLFGV
ncbi:hypothetical protein B0H14DRAFT_2700105 [Mycena olivaceomarginata]|nr:hypothetical protein B0H14DRAFT_2700105 [Mycena olivaceomarginata]